MKTDPVDTAAAQSPGPHPSPMESGRGSTTEREADEFKRVEHVDESPPDQRETPPPQTWKHPDDGKSLSEEDEEIPLKP